MKPTIGPIGWMLLGAACTVALLASGLIALVIPAGLIEVGKNDAFVSAIGGGVVSGALTVVAGLFAIQAARAQIEARKSQENIERLLRKCGQLRIMLYFAEMYALDLVAVATKKSHTGALLETDITLEICKRLTDRADSIAQPVRIGEGFSDVLIEPCLALEAFSKEFVTYFGQYVSLTIDFECNRKAPLGARIEVGADAIEKNLEKPEEYLPRLSSLVVDLACNIVAEYLSVLSEYYRLSKIPSSVDAERTEHQKTIEDMKRHLAKAGLPTV